jgi:uncharacterized repeat protein (TIGR03847 family)
MFTRISQHAKPVQSFGSGSIELTHKCTKKQRDDLCFFHPQSQHPFLVYLKKSEEDCFIMPGLHIDLNPVDLITVDAIGKPGERIFYILGRQADQSISLLVEKVQIQTLAVGTEQFLNEVATQYPDLLTASDDYDEEKMHIHPPLDPLFRVGELGLGYQADGDLVILYTQEILTDLMTAEEASTVHFFCTRSQIKALCRWGLEIASRGRAICPQCGEPMDPAGHFCPKKNGHKH